MIWNSTILLLTLWLDTQPVPIVEPSLCLAPAPERRTLVTFDEAFDLTLSWEGGDKLHTVPGDPGGTTKYGISQRAYPNVDMHRLTKPQAAFYARRDYWSPVKADHLPEEIRWDVFDTAFNAGTHRAGKLLQRSINLCRQAQGVTDFIMEDGRIGPNTLQALEGLDGARLRRVYRAYRAEHYLTLAELGRAKFIHGWLRRAEGERNG